MEWPNRKRRRSLLPHSGTDRHYRIRPAAARWRHDQAHPHDLPRPNERIREKMVEALTATLRRMALLLVFVAFPTTVFSHRLDEYLQATLVVIEPSVVRLQINLTPGVDVAEKVLAQIDSNDDSVISKNE